MGLGALHLLRDHVPLHSGHLVVENDGVHGMRSEQFQAFVPAAGLQDFIAVVFEKHFAANEPIPVVIDAENCFQPRHDCSKPQFGQNLNIAEAYFGLSEEAKVYLNEVAGKLI